MVYSFDKLCFLILLALPGSSPGPAFAGEAPETVIPPAARLVDSSPEVSIVELFPLRSGLSWKYRSNLGKIISRVTGSNKEWIVSSTSPYLDIIQHLVLAEEGILLTKKQRKTFFSKVTRTYSPPLLRLPLRLKTGLNWSWKGTELVNGKTIPSRFEGMIEGNETIRVPAGEFTCLKVRIETVTGDETVSRSTQWLAPKVGVVKARIEIEAGGLTGFLIGILGLDVIEIELEEMLD